MHRDGILCDDILFDSEALRELKEISQVVSGVYTHYHSSDSKEQGSVILQQNKFKSAVSALQNSGFNFDMIHTSNSGACAYSDIAENEFIRPGVLLYGCRPDSGRDPEINIREAARVCSKIISIRSVKKGEGVSYGHSWQAENDTQVATIAMGYADGFPRATVAPHFVVRGLTERFPVVGRITMDYIMLDIGNNTEINVGDEVFLAESIDELALKAGTIGYELLCKFGGLMNRKYIFGGQTVGVSRRELY
jgi:alanine racemase